MPDSQHPRNRHARVREVFLEALPLGGAERSAYLDGVCEEDSELRREVEELLALQDRPDGTAVERLEAIEGALRPSGPEAGRLEFSPADQADQAEKIGETCLPEIEGYRILRRLGEGGMGTVYEAEQQRPVRRLVAVKVLRHGLRGRQIAERFALESQALAMMDHPNIARLFDVGESRDGRPFFAMELVDGQPITDYCNDRQLSAEERLPLIVTACEAVQQAHQRGILHRDLKPSNILVQRFEDRPVIKVIDFGIAKAIRPDLDPPPAQTEIGQFLGTPDYMSPEQADSSLLDIDTRTDVYSLGVILYELLTGVLPFESESYRRSGLQVIEAWSRGVWEQATPRPSARVSELGERSKEIAEERRTHPPALARLLRGDLDWIVLKALEKDRDRRYSSAAALAADIGRFRRREPVNAGPPSVLYRFRKMVRRNRLAVTTAAALLAVILLGLVGTSLGLLRARAAEAEAKQQARTASEVSDFMIDVFRRSDPFGAKEGDVTARELLERAVARIETNLGEEPETRAALMHAMGKVYGRLGMYSEAQPLLEEALAVQQEELGADDPHSAATALSLGWLYYEQGQFSQAEPVLAQAIRTFTQAGGAAEVDLAQAHQTLGVILRGRAEYGRAREHLEFSLESRESKLGPNHKDVGFSLYHLGWLENLEGHYGEAERLYERTLSIWEPQLGADSALVGWCHNDLGAVLANQERFEEAWNQYQMAFTIQEKALGGEHPDLAAPLQNLGILAGKMGRDAEAVEALERALEIRSKALEPGHPWFAESFGALGIQYRRMGDYGRAQEYLEQALAVSRSSHGEESSQHAHALNSLAGLLRRRGELEQARELTETALAIQEKTLGADHPVIAFTATNLAIVEYAAGHYSEAAQHFQRAAEQRQRNVSEGTALAATLCRLAEVQGFLDLEDEGRANLERAAQILDGKQASGREEMSRWLRCRLLRARFEARYSRKAVAAASFRQAMTLLDQEPDLRSNNTRQMQAAYWALSGERQRAIDQLRKAIDLGYRTLALETFPDFSSLRGDPEFEALALASRLEAK